MDLPEIAVAVVAGYDVDDVELPLDRVAVLSEERVDGCGFGRLDVEVVILDNQGDCCRQTESSAFQLPR
jgi:hypothetical protein